MLSTLVAPVPRGTHRGLLHRLWLLGSIGSTARDGRPQPGRPSPPAVAAT